MQLAAMPPYAGLDEAYHVARLAFVAQEGRNPRPDERSIPPYVARSIDGQAGYAPAWPVRSAVTDRRLTADDRRPYTAPNYQSQHPSLYYSLAAPLVRLLPERTQLEELRLWRGISAACALLVVLATAFIGMRVAGAYGLLAAGLLVAMPTWETLLIRASNDGLACAAIACAFAISFAAAEGWAVGGGQAVRRGLIPGAAKDRPPLRAIWFAEALAWALALATKLYAWPIAVGVFALWIVQRAPWKRRLLVMGAGAVAVLATSVELMLRTRNAVGLVYFDPSAAEAPLDWAGVVKITLASFAWTSGPHNNALTPLAIGAYLGPLVACVLLSVVGARWSVKTRNRQPTTDNRQLLLVCAAAVGAFALSQLVNLLAARKFAVDGLPPQGKEGWYWFSLAPLAFGVVVPLVLQHLPRVAALLAVVWVIGWDLAITECALLQDWAGITTPERGDAFFRWGGRQLPFTFSLGHAAVGPLTGIVTELRIVYLAAMAALAKWTR